MWATGLLGATATVFATTLEDAVWLVPYVGFSSRFSKTSRIVHAITFVLTLEMLAIGAVLAAIAIEAGATFQWGNKKDTSNSNSNTQERTEIVLGSVGAILCWTLALYYYIKKMQKRRRKEREQQERAQAEETVGLVTSDAFQQNQRFGSYGSSDYENNNNNDSDDNNEEQHDDNHAHDSMGTVMSLTFVGALDEISYFPALIVGHIFTPLQICLGTLLATLLILTVVTTCLARCKPLADCLDRIPIYAVVALFGTILTLGVLYDIYSD